MQYLTYTQIKEKIERELDIEVEEFIQPEEFLGYCNDGIDIAEAIIHNLGLEAQYFLTRAFIPLVQGQEDYALPSNIYADKIRKVLYRTNERVYEIERLRGEEMFEEAEYLSLLGNSTADYRFLVRNDSAVAGKILQLAPASRESSSQNVRIWYIRNSNNLIDDTSICDLPEVAMQFLYKYLKLQVYEKEVHPNQDSAAAALTAVKIEFIATLENQIPDGKTEVIPDMSFYDEMS